MVSTYIRGINEDFVTDLKSENGKLHGLKKMLEDKAFQMEIREDYLNIYYKGGNLFRVVPKMRSKGYAFEFDKKYLIRENENKQAVLALFTTKTQIRDIESAIQKKDIFCAEMDAWFDKNKKAEREIQQKMCLNNRPNDKGWYLLDIEYARPKCGRADMLFVKKENGQFKLYIVELKQGNGAISSFGSNGKPKAGLYNHYCDAVKLTDPLVRPALIETVKNNIRIRKSLGETFFADTYDPVINESIEFVIALYKYNRSNRHDKNGQPLDKLKKEIELINEEQEKSQLPYHIIMLDDSLDIHI